MEAVSHFKSGRTYYDQGNWPKATQAFKETLALNPNDQLAKIYIDR